MIRNLLIVLFFSVALTTLTSCSEEDGGPTGEFANGAFILNEGGFTHGNASITFLNYTGDSLTHEIFSKVNNRPLGDVLQSAKTSGDKLYLVVNNSNKIEVVNKNTFEEQGVIEGLDGPRFMEVIGDKGYVTQWGAGGAVKVIDLNTFSVTNTIAVGNGPEGIIAHNGNLLIANKGGFANDSTLSIINTTTEEVEKTVQVGVRPNNFVIDVNNDVWVICAGATIYNDDCIIVKTNRVHFEKQFVYIFIHSKGVQTV